MSEGRNPVRQYSSNGGRSRRCGIGDSPYFGRGINPGMALSGRWGIKCKTDPAISKERAQTSALLGFTV